MRVEIFCALKGKSFRTLNCIAPLAEYAEYHPFHREKVELYMAELYNKVGTGLITWSPISLGLCSGKCGAVEVYNNEDYDNDAGEEDVEEDVQD